MTRPEARYIGNEYLIQNPSWDLEDSPWKAAHVSRILTENKVSPRSICEVGCGAGFILRALRQSYPDAELYGFDIAPAASRFWPQHESAGIRFAVGDFLVENKRTYDVILILDVIEHVPDTFAFLGGIRDFGRAFVLHIPLDLSASSVLREKPLLSVRKKVGHIHYFTKGLALSMLAEAGYEVVAWRFSGAGFNASRSTWKTRFAMAPRWLAQRVNKDWAVRALGGETLLVLARPIGQ